MALADPLVVAWLDAYFVREKFGEWPPGRRDPRLLEAFSVIAAEQARMDEEELRAARQAAGSGGAPSRA